MQFDLDGPAPLAENLRCEVWRIQSHCGQSPRCVIDLGTGVGHSGELRRLLRELGSCRVPDRYIVWGGSSAARCSRTSRTVLHSYCDPLSQYPLGVPAARLRHDAGWSSLVARRAHEPKVANRNRTSANVFRVPELRALI